MRPYTCSHALVTVLPLIVTGLLAWLTARLASARDIGTGVFPSRDTASANLRLLSSPGAHSLREERGTLIAWLIGSGSFALVLGVVSSGITPATIPQGFRREIAKLGSGSIATPTGYVSFVFIIFVLAFSLFACAQVAAARAEEADQRLETLLAHPVGRARWLVSRLLIAVGAAAAMAATSGVLAWVGAVSQSVRISLADTLGAGANTLPATLLFLGIAALAYAAVPRAGAALSYVLVAVTFVWYLLADLIGAPAWLAKLTPFAHVGLVPVQQFRPLDAAVMVLIGLLAALAALGLLRRRDLIEA
jgi:polyether ionophore transport system permease protein